MVVLACFIHEYMYMYMYERLMSIHVHVHVRAVSSEEPSVRYSILSTQPFSAFTICVWWLVVRICWRREERGRG